MNHTTQGNLDQSLWSDSERNNDQLLAPRTTKLVSDHLLVQVTLTQLDDREEVKIPDRSSSFFDSIIHQLSIEYPIPINEVWISKGLKNASQANIRPAKKRFTMLVLFGSSLKQLDQHFQLKLKSFKQEMVINSLHCTIQIANHQYDENKLESFKKDYESAELHPFILPQIFNIQHELDPAFKKEDLERQARRLAPLSPEKNLDGKKRLWRLYDRLFEKSVQLKKKTEALINTVQTASNHGLRFRENFEDAFQQMDMLLDNLEENDLKPLVEQGRHFDETFDEFVVLYEQLYGIGKDACEN